MTGYYKIRCDRLKEAIENNYPEVIVGHFALHLAQTALGGRSGILKIWITDSWVSIKLRCKVFWWMVICKKDWDWIEDNLFGGCNDA